MSIELFLSHQIIERYQKLLDVASDEIQRRQIQNLITEEKEKTSDLQRGKNNLARNPIIRITSGRVESHP